MARDLIAVMQLSKSKTTKFCPAEKKTELQCKIKMKFKYLRFKRAKIRYLSIFLFDCAKLNKFLSTTDGVAVIFPVRSFASAYHLHMRRQNGKKYRCQRTR